MARIRSLSQSQSDARVHPTEVDCTWQVVRGPGGLSYLTLSTYGSDARDSEPKVSQTIQLDRTTALKLAELIQETFDV